MNKKLLTLIVLFGVSLVSQVALALDTNKYHGGSYDGYAMGTSATVAWLVDNNKYHGGSYDGYAMATSASDIPLLVQLSSFTATASDGNVILKWSTETELDNAGFAVYRSTDKDGKYTQIGFVPVAEDSEMTNDYQLVDKDVEQGKPYFYYLEDIDLAGAKSKSEIIKVTIPPAKLVLPIPKVFRLLQNYPNPFNPDTWIPYDLASSGPVVISIYNIKGQLVQELNLGNQKAGSYITKSKSAYWDGRNKHGEKAASGVYLYKLRAGKFEATRRMVIIK